MLSAPRQDWTAYQAMAYPHDAAWLRGLTPQQRFRIYEDLHALILSARPERRDWSTLEAWRWQQKAATRLRVVEALHKLDQLRHERLAAEDAG